THGHGASAAATKGLEQMSQSTEQVMAITGWSEEKTNAYMHSAYNGVDGNLGVNTEALGGVVGVLSPVKAGIDISTGQKWTEEDRETLSNTTSEQQSQIQAAIESYRSGANQSIDASNRLTADERHSEVGTYATGFAANFGETQQLMNTTTKSQQEVDTLSRANSLEQREMASLTEKLEVPFQEFVEGQYENQKGKAQQ
ncbi:conjugal transfer protein TraG, partial [Vibrio splendidus]